VSVSDAQLKCYVCDDDVSGTGCGDQYTRPVIHEQTCKLDERACVKTITYRSGKSNLGKLHVALGIRRATEGQSL